VLLVFCGAARSRRHWRLERPSASVGFCHRKAGEENLKQKKHCVEKSLFFGFPQLLVVADSEDFGERGEGSFSCLGCCCSSRRLHCDGRLDRIHAVVGRDLWDAAALVQNARGGRARAVLRGRQPILLRRRLQRRPTGATPRVGRRLNVKAKKDEKLSLFIVFFATVLVLVFTTCILWRWRERR
jgi:hypothetical protein